MTLDVHEHAPPDSQLSPLRRFALAAAISMSAIAGEGEAFDDLARNSTVRGDSVTGTSANAGVSSSDIGSPARTSGWRTFSSVPELSSVSVVGYASEDFRTWYQTTPVAPSFASGIETSLTDREMTVIDALLRIIHQESIHQFVATSSISIDRFFDEYDSSEEIVITQHVPLQPVAALDYWNRLGRSIGLWAEQASPAYREIANERIAVHVEWHVQESGI